MFRSANLAMGWPAAFALSVSDTSVALAVGMAALLLVSWVVAAAGHRAPGTGRGRTPPRRPAPPGPGGWPLLGYLPRLMASADPPLTLAGEARRYGEVLGVNLAGQLVVVLSSPRAAKEAFSNPLIAARPRNSFYNEVIPNGEGVVLASGESWSVQRKFSLSVLRGLGVWRTGFEERIATEADAVAGELRARGSRPFDPTHLLCNAVANVISSVTLGRRLDYDDPRCQRMLAAVNRAMAISGSGGAMQFLPVAQRLTFMPAYRELQRCIGLVVDFLREEVAAHRLDFAEDSPRDFVDSYLAEIERVRRERERTDAEAGADTRHPINADNMLVTIFEMFVAGTETTSSALRWAVLLMLAYPEVQAKVQEELDGVVGRNRLPRLADRASLPYTEATLLEMLRFTVVSPLTLAHRASQDTEVLGFHVPKDTIVLANILAMCRDETVWKDPHTFNPDRFIEDGKLLHRDELNVFSVGRRACLGEQLARKELFIFFSHFLHQFTFKKPDEARPVSFETTNGMTAAPMPYEICAVPRE